MYTQIEEISLSWKEGDKSYSKYLHSKFFVFSCADDDSRVSRTEISLVPSEFDSYQVSADLALTFCLKELRVSKVCIPSLYSNTMQSLKLVWARIVSFVHSYSLQRLCPESFTMQRLIISSKVSALSRVLF